MGVCVEWKAVKVEGWMTQTGQSGGRLVSGPYTPTTRLDAVSDS